MISLSVFNNNIGTGDEISNTLLVPGYSNKNEPINKQQKSKTSNKCLNKDIPILVGSRFRLTTIILQIRFPAVWPVKPSLIGIKANQNTNKISAGNPLTLT